MRSDQDCAPLSWTSERADTLFVCERMRKAAASRRNPQRAERAIKRGASIKHSSAWRHLKPLGGECLLVTDPQANEPAEVAQEPLALLFWVCRVDRFGQHPVEVRR
jgi:hypothetical protein